MLLAESLLGTSSTAANYIEDVFSTYLYTGNSTSGGTQTITNGVDLSTKGGMVWIKGRSAASNNVLFDTTRGAGTTASNNQALSSNLTTAEDLAASYDFLSAFNTDGFTVKQGGTTTATRGTNYNAVTYASWTFRKQAKFFDVVTYTGNGVARTISHNLGSVPGCIIVKRTSAADNWYVYHRSTGNTNNLRLNSTNPVQSDATYWNSTNPTSTVFSVGGGGGADTNANGATYVAYLFAHDAGGFGAAGTDNVITCGSVSVASGTANAIVNLGYEPQFVLWRNADVTDNWYVFDTMRGIGSFSSAQQLNPNLIDAESSIGSSTYPINITSTGFSFNAGNFGWGASSNKFIYIAIRRGPMKTPTSGTSVYAASTYGGNSTDNRTISTGIVADLAWIMNRTDGGNGTADFDRMRGKSLLRTAVTAADENSFTYASFATQSGITFPSSTTYTNASGYNYVAQTFRRAPGFFDVVCYTGTGANTTQTHNLGAIPELVIVKQRNSARSWGVYSAALAANEVLILNDVNAKDVQATYFNSTRPTSSVFSVGTNPVTNGSANTYVAYLFATVAGVSKVFSYTGNGSSQTINCGFTGGARFVLIKRTDSTGDWYVWDSARGIVSGNDPYLLLNSTAAEVTNTDYIDTYSAGFEISSTAPAAINANGGTFIFLAIA